MKEYKGNSLLLFPTDYTVIDIETTGLSPEEDNIIEICAIRYRNHEIADKFTTLINPECNISSRITKLTGITNEMVATAPKINDVLPDLIKFLGDDILVGHNVIFDISFIYNNCINYLETSLNNDFVDTMRIARLLHKENEHNRLSDLALQYNLSYDNAHRAEFDCLLTNELLLIFEKETRERCADDISLSSLLSKTLRAKAFNKPVQNKDADINNPLYGKTVVFTGALEQMQRKDAMQIVADFGGINSDNITKHTNYLVLGNNDYCKSIKEGKSNKHKKAEDYKAKGYDIEIIPECVFFDMIDRPVDTVNIDDIPDNPLYKSLSLSDREIVLIETVKKIIADTPYADRFGVACRSDSYITLLCGNNDFMRFKYSPRAFWISLDIPLDIAKKNIDNPLFSAQENKRQRHWKSSINSIDEIDKLKDFIIASYHEYPYAQ